MAAVTVTEILASAKMHSKTAHETSQSSAGLAVAATSIIAEEVATGVDRSRDALHFHDELNVYDMIAVDAEAFNVVIENERTIVEMVIRLANPTSLLSIAGSVPTLDLDLNSLTIANTTHLDYFERFMNPGALVYDVVSMQDLRDQDYPKVWDCVVINMSSVAHDFSIIDGLYTQLPAGGSIILRSAGDQGNVARYGVAHEYVTCFDSLKDNADCYLYQVPSGLGVAVAVKSR